MNEYKEWTPYLIESLFRRLGIYEDALTDIREELGLDKLERIRAIAEYTSADPRVALEEIRMIIAEQLRIAT